MAKSKDLNPQDEIVRANMIKFRNEADLSQADAADASGVPIDALRRYETGQTASVPGTVIAALGKIYGHSMDDFMSKTPPTANLADRPVFFLRTLPGASVDRDTLEKLQDMIDKANAQRSKKEKR